MKSKLTLFSILIPIALAAFAFAVETHHDKYGGHSRVKGEATGFFHFEKLDGRYWYITPEGNGFFPVALSHLYSGESDLAVNSKKESI